MNTIYVLLDDKNRGGAPRHYSKRDDALFKSENEKGHGVYFSVNRFVGDRRMNKEVGDLRYAYCDMDVAKKGDGQTREQKQEKKKEIIKALFEHCPPTIVIDTSNGLQPLWKLESKQITEELKKEYVTILKGIRNFGMLFGSAGDTIYDIARIVRLPGFYHQKEEPYLCKAIHQSDKVYTYEELKAKFPYFEEKKEYVKPENVQLGIIDQEIALLDIKDVVIKAFASTGRVATFDNQCRLVLDGRLTGTFQGKNDDRQYLASTSHEPFKGNKITVVADILGISNKEARKWIMDEFNIRYDKLVDSKKAVEIVAELQKPVTPINTEKRFTWGTRNLDINFAIIKETNFIVIGAKRNSGKTTYTFDMACKNALQLGHMVLYISLEMETEDILDHVGRKYSGITVEEEFDKKIPDSKLQAFERKKKELKAIEKLKLVGIRRNDSVTWEVIVKVIEEYTGVDMIFIDNLDLISGDKNDNTRQKEITSKMMAYSSEKHIPIILIHHYRKSGKDDRGMDELAGSGKIADNADRIVRVTRAGEPGDIYPKKYMTDIALLKGRGYPEHYTNIYFIKGTFVDTPPVMSEEQMVEMGIPQEEATLIFNEG